MSGEFPAGMSVGAYRIASLIGRGGMGVVYLAEHVTLGRRVALKVVAPELAEDQAFRERFLREARLAASLDHPNIIQVYDAGEVDSILYLAMRYVEGTDLGTVLEEEHRLPADRTLRILAKVASALDEAHRNDLVHRDVKPDNVMLGASSGGEEKVYLTDFGLVKRLDSGTKLTRTGYMMGTLSYMAPEVFRGQDLDGRTDEYSLACVMFECLAGAAPYERDFDAAVISAHLMEPVPSLLSRRPDLPPEIDDIVARGMAKEMQDRFATCGELIAAAENVLRDATPPQEVATAAPPLDATIYAPPPRAATPPETVLARTPSPEPDRSSLPPAAFPPQRDDTAPPPPAPPVRAAGAGTGTGADANRRNIAIAAAVAVVLIGALLVPKLFGGSDTNPRDGGTRGSTGTDGTRPTGPTATGPTGGTGTTGGLDAFATVAGSPAVIDTRVGSVWVTSDDGSSGVLSRIDPSSGEITEIDVGRDPIRVSSNGTESGGAIWVANHQDNTVSRIPLPISGTPKAETLTAGDGPFRILSPEGSDVIWVSNQRGHTVSLFPIGGGPATFVDVGKDPTELSSGFGSVWVVDSGSNSVTRLDASTGAFLATISVGNAPTSIQPADPFLWVANTGDGTVSRIDSVTNQVDPPIGVGSEPTGVTNDREGGIWVRNAGEHSVSRIDQDTLDVRNVDVGGTPVAMAVTPGKLWVATADGVLVRIDVASQQIDERIQLGHTPVSIAAERDQSTAAPDLRGIWVVGDDGAVLHVDAGDP